MFGSAGYGSGAFFADFFFGRVVGAAGVDVDGLGWMGDVAVHVGALGDELAFAAVPFCEDFG